MSVRRMRRASGMRSTVTMSKHGKPANRLLASALAAAAIFALFSVARESLVPFSADSDRAGWRLTGDEPAYLLTAQAIASGHGEDVSLVHRAQTYTNYQQKIVIGPKQWTYSDYVKRCKVKFLFDRRARWTAPDGRPRQILHGGPLEPLMAAPFALSSDRPRWKILFWQGLLASAAIGLALFLAPCGGDTRLQAFACAAVCGSAPVVYYSAQIFPEIAIGSLLLLSLMLAREGDAMRRIAGYACLFLSLWGSSRVVGAVTAAAACWIVAAARKRRFADIAAIAALFAAYFGYHLWQWGNFFPPNTDLASPITPTILPRGFARYWAGNAVGLLLLQPVAWAGVVALALLLRRPGDDPAILPCAALAIGIPLSVAMFPTWRGGMCPAGRYQVAEAMVLMAPLLIYFGHAEANPRWRSRMAFLLCFLGALSLALGLWLALHPNCWWERYHPFFKPKALQPLYRFLPDFDGYWRRPLAALAAFFAAATFLPDIFWRCFPKTDETKASASR